MLSNLGRVWSWGWNKWGQLGVGSTLNRFKPTMVINQKLKACTAFFKISAGWRHSLALSESREISAWGYLEPHDTKDQGGVASGMQDQRQRSDIECIVKTPRTFKVPFENSYLVPRRIHSSFSQTMSVLGAVFYHVGQSGQPNGGSGHLADPILSNHSPRTRLDHGELTLTSPAEMHAAQLKINRPGGTPAARAKQRFGHLVPSESQPYNEAMKTRTGLLQLLAGQGEVVIEQDQGDRAAAGTEEEEQIAQFANRGSSSSVVSPSAHSQKVNQEDALSGESNCVSSEAAVAVAVASAAVPHAGRKAIRPHHWEHYETARSERLRRKESKAQDFRQKQAQEMIDRRIYLEGKISSGAMLRHFSSGLLVAASNRNMDAETIYRVYGYHDNHVEQQRADFVRKPVSSPVIQLFNKTEDGQHTSTSTVTYESILAMARGDPHNKVRKSAIFMEGSPMEGIKTFKSKEEHRNTLWHRNTVLTERLKT